MERTEPTDLTALLEGGAALAGVVFTAALLVTALISAASILLSL